MSDINALAEKIQRVRSNPDDLSWPELRELIAQIGALKKAQVQQLAQCFAYPVSGTKKQMVGQMEDWLVGIKASADRCAWAERSADDQGEVAATEPAPVTSGCRRLGFWGIVCDILLIGACLLCAFLILYLIWGGR